MVRRSIRKQGRKSRKNVKRISKAMLEPQDDNRFYVIEELLEKRTTNHGEQYLVRWRNYPPIWDSWEPAEEIEKNASDMIREFNRIYDNSETSTQLHCLCRKEYRFEQGGMIQCAKCNTWYHFTCINMNMEQANLYQEYYCKSCSQAEPALKSKFKKEKLDTFYGKSLSADL